METEIYLDHAATTPLRPSAQDYLRECIAKDELRGNSSGSHLIARRAKNALEEARERLASLLKVMPSEVIFTSGGTEANNLAIRGVMEVSDRLDQTNSLESRNNRLVYSATEHHSVLNLSRWIGGEMCPVSAEGTIDLDYLESIIDSGSQLVSVMLANNETGVVNDLSEVDKIIKRKAPKCQLHSDAVQAFPYLDFELATDYAQLITLAAHKFGGPKGVGFLVVKKGTKLVPQMLGGGQEFEKRAGTQNVPMVVASVLAAEEAYSEREIESRRIWELRNVFISSIDKLIPGTYHIGHGTQRVPGIINIRFDGVNNEELLVLLDRNGVFASSGASCASGATEPSHVLCAMGFTTDQARSSLRFSLGWTTQQKELEQAAALIADQIAYLRA